MAKLERSLEFFQRKPVYPLSPDTYESVKMAKPGIPVTLPQPREVPDFPSPLPERVPVTKPEPVIVPVKPGPVPAKP